MMVLTAPKHIIKNTLVLLLIFPKQFNTEFISQVEVSDVTVVSNHLY